MTVPQGNVRFFCKVGRIRSSVPLRPTFEDDETWYCGTAIAVPYVKLHKVLGVTGYYDEVWLNPHFSQYWTAADQIVITVQ